MTKQPHEIGYTSPKTVAELRARIEESKAIALRRLSEHAADGTQSQASRDVCAELAKRMAIIMPN